MNALVVIDMQPSFVAARDKKTQANVLAEIEKAKARHDKIIIVRFADCGRTVPSIMKAVRGYDRLHTKVKFDDDGSLYIRKFLLGIKKIRICGVNTDCCVAETAAGLGYMFPDSEIMVVLKACNSCTNYIWAERDSINMVRRRKAHNVRFLYKKIKDDNHFKRLAPT